MSTTRKIEGLNVTVIESQCTGTGNAEVEKFGSIYGQVRFADGTRVSNLMTDGFLDSFFTDDARRFYLAKIGKVSVLLGVLDMEGVFHDFNVSNFRSDAKKAIWGGAFVTLFGIVMTLFIVGIFIFIAGVMMLNGGFKLLRAVRAAETLKGEFSGAAPKTRQVPSITALPA